MDEYMQLSLTAALVADDIDEYRWLTLNGGDDYYETDAGRLDTRDDVCQYTYETIADALHSEFWKEYVPTLENDGAEVVEAYENMVRGINFLISKQRKTVDALITKWEHSDAYTFAQGQLEHDEAIGELIEAVHTARGLLLMLAQDCEGAEFDAGHTTMCLTVGSKLDYALEKFREVI